MLNCSGSSAQGCLQVAVLAARELWLSLFLCRNASQQWKLKLTVRRSKWTRRWPLVYIGRYNQRGVL